MQHSKEDCLKELHYLVENKSKAYLNIINGTGIRHLTSRKIQYSEKRDKGYLRDFIKEQTPLLDSSEYKISTKLFWIFHNITSWDDPLVKCEQCGKPFIGRNVHNVLIGYPRFCCRKCQGESPTRQQKTRETCLQRYGVTNSYLIPEVVRKCQDNKEEIQRKKDETKMRNHTFKDSNNEKLAGEFLKILYPDLIFQYKSSKYPFNCDFYSPSKDLYIEYNGSWTHGGRFYDPLDESCQKQLEDMKEKTKISDFYLNAIETWTVRDVAKRKFAEENHLNYLVFWSIHEVAAYLNQHGIFPDFVPKKGRTPVSIQIATDICKEHSEEAFHQFKTWSFPYPEISDSQIEWELNALSTKIVSDKQFSPTIRKYHQSMWSCSKDGQMSPVNYWEHFKKVSKEKWDKFYINRIVHAGEGVLDENKILKPGAIRYGFEVLRYSNCVSYLKPFLAKRLISTYLSEFTSVFCPMNGFSGLLLGTVLGCGKRYVGQDLNAVQISEAKNIVKMLTKRNLIEKDQVSLSVKDVFEDSGKYDCLIVCPPYGSKEKWNFDLEGNCIDVDLSCEEWMDVILERYSCRRYLFIVDGEERTKFDDHIVEILRNRSHFNQNVEKIIMVSK